MRKQYGTIDFGNEVSLIEINRQLDAASKSGYKIVSILAISIFKYENDRILRGTKIRYTFSRRVRFRPLEWLWKRTQR